MLIERDGLWWPEADEAAHRIIPAEAPECISWFLSHVGGRESVVQAGGNVGLYAMRLSKVFRSVVTAEPDPENFAALVKNLADCDNIVRLFAAFSDANQLGFIAKDDPANCGAHRVEPGLGVISMIRIDDLGLQACDAIWLDVEGSELPALKGAEETIKRFHPVIVTEEKNIGLKYGYEDREIGEWLSQFGYRQASSLWNDRLYKVDK